MCNDTALYMLCPNSIMPCTNIHKLHVQHMHKMLNLTANSFNVLYTLRIPVIWFDYATYGFKFTIKW